MKLTFLGTRGYIPVRTRRHRRHSSLLVTYRATRILVDCGEDWRGRSAEQRPRAILLTHAHPDHAGGLHDGALCPVYATAETWHVIRRNKIGERGVIPLRTPLLIAGMVVEAFPVEHSVKAPAVGYRIRAGRATLFYAPDVVYIHDRTAALSSAALYVGDGATLERPLIRRRGTALIGHSPITTQLAWCQKERVPRAIFTHCGSQIVAGDGRALQRRVRELGEERRVKACIAQDGMQVLVR